MLTEETVRLPDIIGVENGQMDGLIAPNELNCLDNAVIFSGIRMLIHFKGDTVVQQEDRDIFRVVGEKLNMDVTEVPGGSVQDGAGDIGIEWL